MPSSSVPLSANPPGWAWELPPSLTYHDAILGVGEIGVVRLEAFDCEEHSHPYAQIIVPIGPAEYEVRTRATPDAELRSERLTGRHVAFIAPGVRHTGRPQGRAELLVFFVRPSFLHRVLGDRRWTGVVIGEFAAAVGKDRYLLLLTELCTGLWGNPEASERRLIEDLAHSIVLRLLRTNFADPAPTTHRATVLTPNQLRIITDHIHEHLAHMPSLGELARLIGLSPLHFARVFKATTGTPPKRFFTLCVMQRAAELLRSGNFRVEEVAYQLGYDDPGYFGRAFRRIFRRSPSQYQREHRAKSS